MLRVTYGPGFDPTGDPDAFRRRGEQVGVVELADVAPGTRLSIEDTKLDEVDDRADGWTLRYAVVIRDVRERTAPLATAGDLAFGEPAPAPIEFGVDPTADGIRLSWQIPEGWQPVTEEPTPAPTSFNVYRAAPGEPFPERPINTIPVIATDYLDSTVTLDATYRYGVRILMTAVPSVREGLTAGPMEVRATDRFAPAVPDALIRVQQGLAVRLFWSPNDERDLAGYRVYRRVNGGKWKRIGPDPIEGTGYVDEDVRVGQRLDYRVSAVDRMTPPNESEFTEPVEVEILAEPNAPGD